MLIRLPSIFKSAGVVTNLGDFEQYGFPATNTFGDRIIPVADPGIPFYNYDPLTTDPLAIWKSQPSVRKVVGFAAREFASISWHAYERVSDQDRRRRSDSAAEQLLREPHKFVTGYSLMETLAIDKMIYDVWCVVLGSDAAGRPELTRIPPKLLDIRSDKLGRVTAIYLRYEADGQVIRVSLHDAPIAIGWGWSPLHAGGVSPLRTLAAILEESRRAIAWRNAQWSNSPKFGGVLKRPAEARDWAEEKRTRFVQSWREWRDTNAGGTPILEDGMDYEVIDTVNPSEKVRDIEGRTLTDVEVASAFFIPPELVGARQGTFSNIAAFRQMLFGPTLGPLFQEFQQAFNSQLVSYIDPTPGLYVEMDRESALNGSFLEQAQILSTATGGPWLTRNEARGRMNLSRLPGGDELITPLNVVVGGQASPQDTGTQNQSISAAVTRKALMAKDNGATKPANLGTPKQQRDALQAAIAEIIAEQKAATGNQAISEAKFHKTWDARMAAALGPHLSKAALYGAWKVLSSRNPEADGWDPDVMDGYLEAMANTTAAGINSGVIAKVNSYVEDDDAEHDADSGFDTAALAVSAAWAATAITQAAGFGGHDAAKASGQRTKTWLVNSAHPRPEHAAMDGESVDIDGVFSNGARWPGDVNLDADQSAGCTCSVEFDT